MKRNRIKYIFLSLATCAIVTSGCNKLLDINQDPNNLGVDQASIETLFPSGVVSTAARSGGDIAIIGGMWAQYWAQNVSSSQYRDYDSFNVSATDPLMNLSYQELYTGALLDYKSVIEKAKAKQDWRFYLMGVTMKAYTFQLLADLYDKVPYTEALQGDAFVQPKFDDGYTIYKALIAELDDALAKDYEGADPFTASQQRTDFVFGNNGTADFAEEMKNWGNFANTLKLKIFLRMVNAKPNEAEAGIKAMINGDKDFLNVSAGVTAFKDEPNASNPFYEINIRRSNTPNNLKASSTLGRWLKQNNDPRVNVYYGSDDPLFMNQGDFGNPDPALLLVQRVQQAATDPVWFISQAESFFMQAEADERYLGGAKAEDLYKQGVIAAFVERGIVDAAAKANVLLAGAYKYPAGRPFEEKLEAIIMQKWAACFGSHAIEGFFEKQRTGYPRTSAVYSSDAAYVPGRWVHVPASVVGENFPKRYVFPDYERSRNSNTPAPVPITTPVWWAK